MGSEDVKKAVEDLLREFDIQFEEQSTPEEIAKLERKGDYSALIQKTNERLDELSIQADQLLKDNETTQDEIEAYATNRENFTDEQWAALEKFRQSLVEFREKTRYSLGDATLKKTTERSEKTKGRFGKKKSWIAS